MTLLETAKFAKLRKKIKDESEREALRAAVLAVRDEPQIGKKLKGELDHLRSMAYSVRGQARRLVYQWDKDTVTLFSFGPRQGIYK
ncbi:MAG: type II toxin-antitoxin system RelE/ParE family toxin [Candidatus Aminicenantes bacterium]|nr:type II toxin-antitoxin system RelE/ParE family toxin [Candidatus Aminicenantes bacterium]